MTISLKEAERIDDLQIKGYQIIQNPNQFCFGMDAVILSHFARIKEGQRVLDLGTGTGVIPILLEAKTKAGRLTGLEIQEDSADMARRSVTLNKLEAKIEIITGDIKEAGSIFGGSSFGAVTCNPPYMIGKHGILNPQAPKAIARHEILCTLEDVIRESAKVLLPGGNFFLVHRPFRLPEIMGLMSQYGIEPKRMQLVHPYADKEPNMVLLEGCRGGRPRMHIEKPLVCYSAPNVYGQDILDIYQL